MKSTFRNTKGQLGPLYLIMLVLAIALLGAIALDYAHVVEVKAELQNATDAGALAGAAHLCFDIDNAAPDALKFTAANYADGRKVADDSPGTDVNVTVQAPTQDEYGKVTVTASMDVGHFLAKMFGRMSDRISVHSVAGTSGLLWRAAANQLFPIAVSWDYVPNSKGWNGTALNTLDIGSTFDIYLGSQGVKNGTFTSFTKSPANANFIKDAIDQLLGFQTPIEGFIPSVGIGDNIDLINGMLGMQQLAKKPYVDALVGKTLALVVVQGDPAYNQKRPVIAIIGYKVTQVLLHEDHNKIERIRGTLVKLQLNGETGPYPATGTWPPGNISRIEVGPIQLIE